MSALTSDLQFSLKATMAKAKSTRVNISPIQGAGVLNPGDRVSFDVPCGKRGMYVDPSGSYIQFKVKNTDPTTANKIALDGSAASLINRMEVYSGGSLLESIQNYNVLYQGLIDTQVSVVDRLTTLSIASGTDQQADSSTVNVSRGGPTIAGASSAVFNLPLLSGVLGNMASKFLPVGAINNDLRLEITLEQAAIALISHAAATPGYQVTEFTLILQILELGDEAQAMVEQMTGGNYMISSETYRNASTLLANGSTADSVLLPFRFSSLKSLYWCFRPATPANGSFTASSICNRLNPYDNATQGSPCSVQLRLGPLYIPNAPIRYSGELFTELQKSYHRYAAQTAGTSFGWSQWSKTAAPSVTLATQANMDANLPAYQQQLGAGFFGLNLDAVANRSEVIHSGVSSLNQNMFLDSTYATVLGAQTRFDAWVHADMIIQIENGVCSTLM